MGRKKNLKSISCITGKSQKGYTNRRSSSSLDIQTTMGDLQQCLTYQPISSKDNFSEGTQPWMMLLFDIKIGEKCKSHPNKKNSNMPSSVSFKSSVDERRDSSVKLSSLFGDVTLDDWSNQSYLILMTLREDDSSEDGTGHLHDSGITHLAINKMSFEVKSESRPTMASVLPLRELCQTALEVSQLKHQRSPAPKMLEQMGKSDDLRQIETCHFSYSVPSLRDLSKVVVDRSNKNSVSRKNAKVTSSTSEDSAPTLRQLCETVVRCLHQHRLLSKETGGAEISSFEDNKRLHTVPCLRHLAENVLKSQRISLTDKGSNMPILKDSRQSCTVPTLRHLTKLVVKDLHLSPRDNLPYLDDRVNSYTVPSLRQLAGIVVKDLRLSSGNKGFNVPSLEYTRQFNTVPSLRQLAGMAVKDLRLSSGNKRSDVPCLEYTRQFNTVPSLRQLAGIVAKDLRLSSKNKGFNVPSLEYTRQFNTVPSLRQLAGIVVKDLRLSSGNKRSNVPSLEYTRQFNTVPSLRQLAGMAVNDLRLSSGNKRSNVPSLEYTRQFNTVPSLQHFARMMVNSLHLSSTDNVSHMPLLGETKQSCNVPSLHDLARKMVNAREPGSTMPSFENKQHTYTAPSPHDLTERLAKSLSLNSRDKVSTGNKLRSSRDPTPVTDRHLFTVPSLRHLCQKAVDGLQCKQKEKQALPAEKIETQQKIPSLLELKVTRPRIKHRPKLPVSGFPMSGREPMPWMTVNRPMYPMGSRYTVPRVRQPMTRQPFWRMNRPPPNLWPRGGACERYGVAPFGPRYGRF